MTLELCPAFPQPGGNDLSWQIVVAMLYSITSSARANPYYRGDEVGLTQTLGWVDAWTSQPSA